MITIIGINHTKEKKEELKNLIFDIKPNLICLELDDFRYKHLKNELSSKEIADYYKDSPKMYQLVSLYRRASHVNTKTEKNWEINTVFEISNQLKTENNPVDSDQITIYKEIDKMIPFNERMRFYLMLIRRIIFLKITKKSGLTKDISLDKYPTVKKYLIDERNKQIIERVKKINEVYDNIIIIVGNAHAGGIGEKLKEKDPKIIDLNM